MERAKIISISEPQENGNYSWRECVVEIWHEKYPRKLMLKANRVSFDFLDKLTVGDELAVTYPGESMPAGQSLAVEPKSREYNGKYYTELTLVRVNV